MKSLKTRIKIAVAMCMAVLLCLSATGMAAATSEPPAEKSYYFDNYYTNWDTVYCYAWVGGEQNAAWPGEPMTQESGSALWKTTLEEDAYEWIIFNNGQNVQTLDLMILDDYDTFSGNHMSSGKVNGYWRNANEYITYAFLPYDYWDNADCYASYWNNSIQQNWPGIKMNKSDNYYFITLPPEAQNIIFNNGGNGKQTTTLQTSSFTSNSIALTGSTIGQDPYGNTLYEISFLPPLP